MRLLFSLKATETVKPHLNQQEWLGTGKVNTHAHTHTTHHTQCCCGWQSLQHTTSNNRVSRPQMCITIREKKNTSAKVSDETSPRPHKHDKSLGTTSPPSDMLPHNLCHSLQLPPPLSSLPPFLPSSLPPSLAVADHGLTGASGSTCLPSTWPCSGTSMP